ncbi:hypothetical protein BSU01_14345 [Erwinia billingiae]|uniref:hypothetical protein n=1 Tax=Erwinia billingiae TaxID=182337 RepID=UPI0019CFDE64|nr:hypothetical protein [Erwinia billingiae]MBN7122880.1 hypothetical protein [Erwinia billingiae]
MTLSRIKWSAVAVLVLMLTVLALVWGLLHYHGKAVSAQDSVKQLQSETTTQSAIISSQAFSFQHANEIADTARQYTTTITGNAQEKEIEYRTILKSQPTCSLDIPADVAGRLLDYTNRLRASAMHPDAIQPDSTSAASTSTGTLTYCQAVLWIDPLLTAIDQANNQLAAIRQIEKDRQNAKAN